MAVVLDGKGLAAEVKLRVKGEIESLGISPGLAVVIVGDDAASRIYVKNKIRDCAECGIRSFEFALPGSAEEDELLAIIKELNGREEGYTDGSKLFTGCRPQEYLTGGAINERKN